MTLGIAIFLSVVVPAVVLVVTTTLDGRDHLLLVAGVSMVVGMAALAIDSPDREQHGRPEVMEVGR